MDPLCLITVQAGGVIVCGDVFSAHFTVALNAVHEIHGEESDQDPRGGSGGRIG